jgi:Protein of unknown function (DUF2971)
MFDEIKIALQHATLLPKLVKDITEQVPIIMDKKRSKYPKKIYKYITNDINILRSITIDGRIRFSQKEALNDKFELQLIKKQDESPNNFIQAAKDNNLNKFASEILKLSTKNNEEADQTAISNIQKYSYDNLLILSLTANPFNNPMWAHYANNHKGFIIEIDTSHNYFNYSKESAGLFKVTYSKLPLKYPSPTDGINFSLEYDDMLSKIKNYIFDAYKLFLDKSEDWAYEKEWRMFRELNGNEQTNITDEKGLPVYLFDLPVECITGIIWGQDSSEDDKSCIESLKRDGILHNNIQLYDTYIDKDDRTIKFINHLTNIPYLPANT